MPNQIYGLSKAQIIETIQKLTDNLVDIRDESGEYHLHNEGKIDINDKDWECWGWTQGVGLYGLYRYYELTRDPKTFEVIRGWFNRRFQEGTIDRNVNAVAPLLTLTYLYEETGDKKYLPLLTDWLEWAMYDMARTDDGGIQHTTILSENRQQLWDDTLMMAVMPLARGGKLFHKPEYIEEAKKQFLLHIRYLSDKKTGLWFHGWTFDGRHNFGDTLWGRGNCWATITMTDFLDLLSLPADDYYRQYLQTVLHAQIDALCKYQSESGLWHTVLNDTSTYEEASATAGFAYGILKAVRKHYIDPSYLDTGIRAIKAVLANIAPDGTLRNVSIGTPIYPTSAEYNLIPVGPMPYGQSLAVMALAEFMHCFL